MKRETTLLLLRSLFCWADKENPSEKEVVLRISPGAITSPHRAFFCFFFQPVNSFESLVVSRRRGEEERPG